LANGEKMEDAKEEILNLTDESEKTSNFQTRF